MNDHFLAWLGFQFYARYPAPVIDFSIINPRLNAVRPGGRHSQGVASVDSRRGVALLEGAVPYELEYYRNAHIIHPLIPFPSLEQPVININHDALVLVVQDYIIYLFADNLPQNLLPEHLRGLSVLTKQCSICQDNLTTSTEAYNLLCGHSFHVDCFEPWASEHNTCPNCRKEFS